jgi:hypothetical protein
MLFLSLSHLLPSISLVRLLTLSESTRRKERAAQFHIITRKGGPLCEREGVSRPTYVTRGVHVHESRYCKKQCHFSQSLYGKFLVCWRSYCERASGSSSAPLLLNFNVARGARASHSRRGQARNQLFFFSIFIHTYGRRVQFRPLRCCSNQHWVLVVCSLPCFCMPTEFIGILLPADIEKRGPLAVWLAGCSLAYFARARRLTLISHACITRWPAAVLLFRRQCSLFLYRAESPGSLGHREF